MSIVSPSLLAANFYDLKSELTAFDAAKDIWFHLDIMDSHFVPNLTFGHPVVKSFCNEVKHPLDAHFMVTNPDFFIDNFSNLNIHNFTFHWEACLHHDRLIAKAKQNYKSVGISLNPSTEIHVIPDYILKDIDLILLMSVNPGFGGQSFIESTLDKVKLLKERINKLGSLAQIQVDGGVTDKNAKSLRDAGADNLVAGSYIFKESSQNYIKQIDSLR